MTSWLLSSVHQKDGIIKVESKEPLGGNKRNNNYIEVQQSLITLKINKSDFSQLNRSKILKQSTTDEKVPSYENNSNGLQDETRKAEILLMNFYGAIWLINILFLKLIKTVIDLSLLKEELLKVESECTSVHTD